jgi:hypothetical protein
MHHGKAMVDNTYRWNFRIDLNFRRAFTNFYCEMVQMDTLVEMATYMLHWNLQLISSSSLLFLASKKKCPKIDWFLHYHISMVAMQRDWYITLVPYQAETFLHINYVH